jgi:Domain of unknown function (DUF4430)
VFRRPLVLLGLAVLVLGVAAPAFGARVHIRVEGPHSTIFGPTEPLVTPVTGTFAPPAGPAVTVNADTPIGALERASRVGDFYYRVDQFAFGPYVSQIGRYGGTETTGWVYKVNGVSPPVSAAAYQLRPGDRVLFYHATFGPAGGPRTLAIAALRAVVSCPTQAAPCPRIRCYDARAQDDNGRFSPVSDAIPIVDGRRVGSRGRVCPPRHWHTVRFVRPGFVRSRVLTGPRRGTGRAAAGIAGAALGRS